VSKQRDLGPPHAQAKGRDHVIVKALDSHPKALLLVACRYFASHLLLGGGTNEISSMHETY